MMNGNNGNGNTHRRRCCSFLSDDAVDVLCTYLSVGVSVTVFTVCGEFYEATPHYLHALGCGHAEATSQFAVVSSGMLPMEKEILVSSLCTRLS